MEGCEVGAVDGLWTHLISGWASPHPTFCLQAYLIYICLGLRAFMNLRNEWFWILYDLTIVKKNAARLNLMPHDDESCGLSVSQRIYW